MDYRRVHKQTGEVVIGKWKEIADLDKRVWSEPEAIVAYLKEDDELYPLTAGTFNTDRLCSVRVRVVGNVMPVIWRDIYNSADLIGLYI